MSPLGSVNSSVIGIVPIGFPKGSYCTIVGTTVPSASNVTMFNACSPSPPTLEEVGTFGKKALKKVVACSLSSPALSFR